jgi:hypothetical protein
MNEDDRRCRCGAELTRRDRSCLACGAPTVVVAPFLEVVSGPFDGLARTVPEDGLRIGSSPGQVHLSVAPSADGDVGALVWREGPACFLAPLDGHAAPQIEGRAVEGKRRIAHRDVVVLGRTSIVFFLPADGDAHGRA